MNVVRATLKKELMSYFFSPAAYVIAVLFYEWRGWEVWAVAEQFHAEQVDADLFSTAYLFRLSTHFMVVLVPPILTMRCFAEERRTGSLEVLLTAPVTETQIVVGKWLAATIFFAVLWMPTLLLLWVLTLPPFLGADLAFGPVLTGYLGLFLLGCLLLAVGCFASSLTDNLLLAALAAMLANIVLLYNGSLLRPVLGELVEESTFLRSLLEQFDIPDHLGNWFGRGLVDSGQVAFYVVGTCVFLFLTVLSLWSRRWR